MYEINILLSRAIIQHVRQLLLLFICLYVCFAVWTFICRRRIRVHHQRWNVCTDSARHRICLRHRIEPQKNYDGRYDPNCHQLLHSRASSVHANRKVRANNINITLLNHEFRYLCIDLQVIMIMHTTIRIGVGQTNSVE